MSPSARASTPSTRPSALIRRPFCLFDIPTIPYHDVQPVLERQPIHPRPHTFVASARHPLAR